MVAAIVASLFVQVLSELIRQQVFCLLRPVIRELQATVDIIARDIQRAGYDEDAVWNLARDANGNQVNASGAITTIDKSAMFFSAFITSVVYRRLRDAVLEYCGCAANNGFQLFWWGKPTECITAYYCIMTPTVMG